MQPSHPHTPRSRDGRRLLRSSVLFAAALLFGLSSAPVAAHAATGESHGHAKRTAAKAGTAGAPANARTFAVQPSGASGGPRGSDPRPYFSYSVTPGATLLDHAAVHNYSTRPLTLTLYAAKAYNAGDGGFNLETAGRTPTDVGAWTTLRPKKGTRATGKAGAVPAPLKVTVAARSTTVVAFRIAVPANATPGDHAGGIVASVATEGRDAHGDLVTVDERVGARVYLRVAGPLRPKLAVVGLHADYQGPGNPVGTGRITTSYTVRNTGNVQFSVSQLLHASNLLGSYAPTRVPDKLPLLLPGGSATFTEQIDHVRPGGLSHVKLSLTAHPVVGQHDPALPKVRASTSVWTVPWLILAVVAGAAAGAAAWRQRHRLRRTRPDAGGSAAAAPQPQPTS